MDRNDGVDVSAGEERVVVGRRTEVVVLGDDEILPDRSTTTSRRTTTIPSCRMIWLLVVVLAWLSSHDVPWVTGFAILRHSDGLPGTCKGPTISTRRSRLSRTMSWRLASPEKENDASAEYLKTASKLRQEALELEKKLRKEKESTEPTPTEKIDLPSPMYKEVKDSVWTLSYLFSSEPKQRNTNEESEAVSATPTRFGGKLTLHFKPDGYTDLVSHQPDAGSLNIVKAWGWDLETSNEDDLEYLLFSIDVLLPSGSKERFYMQAKQEVNSGEITLKGGTVTVKQDVTETGSRWGLFSPKGILAEFRYVGDFVARSSALS